MSNQNNTTYSNVKPKVSSLNLASQFKPQSQTSNKPASGILLLGRKNAVKSVNAPKPFQLPSYKKESRGFDSTVSIVPSGQSGWRVESSPSVQSLQPSPQPQHVNDARSTTPQPSTQVQPSQVSAAQPPAGGSSAPARWAAPAVPQPVKYTRTVLPDEGGRQSNDARRDESHAGASGSQYGRREHVDSDDEMRDDARRRRRPSGNQWDESDEEMDFSKPVVFADGTVAGTKEREQMQQQQSKWATQAQHHSQYDRQPRSTQRSAAMDRSRSPEPRQRRPSQYTEHDETEEFMRAKAAERRAHRQAEEDRLLREQHQRAQAKLAEIEAKLGRGSVSSQQQSGSTGRYRHDSEYSNDGRQRRFSEREHAPELRFGPSGNANDNAPTASSPSQQQPTQQFKLMQRPKSIDSVGDSAGDASGQQQTSKPAAVTDVLKKQKPIQLITKIAHADEAEQSPIKIVPAPQPAQQVEQQPLKPAWKPLPQVTPMYTEDNDEADRESDRQTSHQSHHNSSTYEHDRFNNARTSDELIAAAAETFAANEFDRGTGNGRHRQNSHTNPNSMYISTQRRPPQSVHHPLSHTAADVRHNDAGDAPPQRRVPPPHQRNVAPRKWADDDKPVAAPVTAVPAQATQLSAPPVSVTARPASSGSGVTIDVTKVMNIMDLPLNPAGLPILPGLSAQQANDKKQRKEQRKVKEVKQVTDSTAATPAAPADKPRKERKDKTKQDKTVEGEQTNASGKPVRGRKAATQYVAKPKAGGEVDATEQLLNELHMDDADADMDDTNNEAGFERVLSKKEREEAAKRKREQEAAIAREKAKLARQDEYRKDRERSEQSRSANSTPVVELSAGANAAADAQKQSLAATGAATAEPLNTKPLNVDIPAASQQQDNQLLNQLQAAYPQLPQSQLEQYIANQQRTQFMQQTQPHTQQQPSSYSQSPQPHEQSSFMSMFRQSPAPSLSPVASYVDSPAHTSVRPVLSPSATNVSGDEYLLHQNTASARDVAIRTLIAQQNAQQQSNNTFMSNPSINQYAGAGIQLAGQPPQRGNSAEFSPLQQQLFSGWNEQQHTGTNGQTINSPFGSSGGLGLSFGGLSSVSLSHIHVLAQHFGMPASAVAKFNPQQLASLTSTYQQQQSNTTLQQLRSTAANTKSGLSATSSAFISQSSPSTTTENTVNASFAPFNSNASPFASTNVAAAPFSQRPSIVSPTNSGTDSSKSVGPIKAPLPHRKANAVPSSQFDKHANNVPQSAQSSAPPASSRLHGWIPKSAINTAAVTPADNPLSAGGLTGDAPVQGDNGKTDATAAPASKTKRNNRNGKKKAERAESAAAAGTDVKQGEPDMLGAPPTATDDKQRARVPITATRGRGGKQPRPQNALVQPVDTGAVPGQSSEEAKENDTTTAAAAPKRERTSRRGGRSGGPKQPRDNTVPASPGTGASQPAAPKYKPVVKPDANVAAPPPAAQPSAVV